MTPSLYATMVAAAVFASVMAVGLLLAYLVSQRAERRLQVRLRGNSEQLRDEDRNPVLGGLARRGRQIEQLIDTEGEIGRLLLQAGWRDMRSRMMYYAFQAALPLALGALVLVMWIADVRWVHGGFLLVAIFVAVALSYLIPINVLRRIAAARRKRIAADVPLFVHLLVLLFEAGLSTRQAFATMAREGHGVLRELGEELDLIVRQIDAGGDSAEAMSALSDAQQIDDLSSIFAVLRQVDRYGGEVREPLLDSLRAIEDRRAMEVRETVNRMSGQMTVVMVLFFFPALLVFVAGPAFTSILKLLKGMTH